MRLGVNPPREPATPRGSLQSMSLTARETYVIARAGVLMKTHSKGLDVDMATRIATVALGCVHREYPNKISHVLSAEADVAPPRSLTPAFYGCYDWHSAVHNHWLLARLARLFPDARLAPAARQALEQSLTSENIGGEVAYLTGEGRQSFERPYGLAWLLQLAQELDEWNDPAASALAANLLPLEQAARQRLSDWLPKLPFAVRSGEHSQTAFALGLMIDYAHGRNHGAFLDLLRRRAREFYLGDKNWPIAYEPSGEDFLSPGLAEADLMRRVLAPQEFAAWLDGFFPQSLDSFRPVNSPDPSDPKFSHLDGLNLSRAWMLEGVASALAKDDSRAAVLLAAAKAHGEAGLAAIGGEHYVGSHWLGTFAVYLLTHRGIAASRPNLSLRKKQPAVKN